MMEFTTPPSYGSTVVNVGGIIENDKILYAGATNVATHVESTKDSENDWPEPKTVKYVWDGTKTTTKAELDTTEPLQAELEGSLGKRLDRIDVMAEVPGFVKSIVGSVAGTRPYIYQVRIWLLFLVFCGGFSFNPLLSIYFSFCLIQTLFSNGSLLTIVVLLLYIVLPKRTT